MEERLFLERKQVVLHFDLAENWSVNLTKPIQSYYFHKKQLYLHMCGDCPSFSTKSFAVVGGHLCHDSALSL